ncbi:SDR family NAD(P)-dependent oxidoreductase [Streptantibioticus silvisoli]|uniref:SDR family NAD(P)-dependent oxidoreductase n=1 Tax=Streptantibioticus silvisoli TaxID=2705255 RepID=A0ABT6W572_9ACTN|nr:SDR family NAD(P)-dependent oxidoreductase [Streptantibioticus silvisoli]MDI5965923.1 SDR family NAD(P)-dependent oxidoreductase [Streptantibioticus silvisoli]
MSPKIPLNPKIPRSRPSVVVTGATSATGQAITMELARTGFAVIAACRTREKAEALRERAARTGPPVRTVVVDVADATSTVRAFTEIATMTGGGPWAVVNNADFAQPGAVEDVDDELARRQLETNLLAPARIARLVLPSMRARRRGRIVNVSCLAGRVTMPMLGWYCASKQGLEAVTDALRMECAPFGVRVSMVEPWSYGSRLWAGSSQLLPQSRVSAYRKQYEAAGEPVRRGARNREPAPGEVARAVRRALTERRPRSRYPVGGGARSTAALDALAPTAASDWAKMIATGLREAPPRLARVIGLPLP